MKKLLYLFGILTVLMLTAVSTVPAAHAVSTHVATKNTAASAQCTYQLPYPDSSCTPGAVFSDVTASDVCTPGYSSGVRNVSTSTKNYVYSEYGITSHTTGQYEIDHFIPLELGGSNDVSNLWPEPASPTPGFHEKDKVENYLHDQVCSGALSLSDAQSEIANDWVAVYNSIP